MAVIKQYLTNNPYYQVNVAGTDSRYVTFQKRGPQGIMLHSVGCSQPDATVFVKRWNNASYDNACVHAFIDGNTGTVYQTMPWNFRAPHCGGNANNTHLGIEMCEPASIKYGGGSTFTVSDRSDAMACVKRTYEAAVQLFADICKEYSLNPSTAIISHKEGCSKGLASNHGDPEHLWKGLGTGYTMDGFRKDVAAAMAGKTQTTTTGKSGTLLYRVRKTWENSGSQIGAYSKLENAKQLVDANPGYYVFDGSGKAVYPTETKAAATVKALGTIPYYRFTAGNSAVSVYADTARTNVIGHLNAGEVCHCIEAGSAECLVWYALDDGSGYKAGYVKRSEGTVG